MTSPDNPITPTDGHGERFALAVFDAGAGHPPGRLLLRGRVRPLRRRRAVARHRGPVPLRHVRRSSGSCSPARRWPSPTRPTFTFWHAQYTSIWVDLQTVERYSSLDPTGAGYTPLQTPTARQAASVAVYDTSAKTFPLLDIANHYVLVGSSFSPSVLDGLSQSQIADDLAFPTSPVTQAILASANEITAAICTRDRASAQPPSATRAASPPADAKMKIHQAA